MRRSLLLISHQPKGATAPILELLQNSVLLLLPRFREKSVGEVAYELGICCGRDEFRGAYSFAVVECYEASQFSSQRSGPLIATCIERVLTFTDPGDYFEGFYEI
jgi:hypothetical protein